MFGKSQTVKELEEKLEKAETALAGAQQLNAQLIESFAQTTTLMDIDVRKGNNIFTLQRDGQVFYVETYHMMQDDVKLWKQQAGLEE